MAHDPDDIHYYVDGSGNQGEFREGDDLEKEVLVKLGDYLSSQTTSGDRANKYAIDPGSSEAAPSDIITGGPNTDAFSRDTSLEMYSEGFLDMLAENIRTVDYLNKGESGHELLQNTETTAVDRTGQATSEEVGDTPAQKQVSQVLKSNRFTASPSRGPFISNNTTNDTVGYKRPEMGTSEAPTESEITYARMTDVALSILYKASGYGLKNDVDPKKINLKSLAPTGVKFGTSKVRTSEFLAKNSYGGSDLPQIAFESDLPDGSRKDSYGAPYNPLQPFGSPVSPGDIVTLAAMVGAFWAALSGFLAIHDKIAGEDSGAPVKIVERKSDPGPYGSFYEENYGSKFLRNMLGLTRTRYSYKASFERGFKVFFGIPLAQGLPKVNLADSLQENLKNIINADFVKLLQNKGYYLTLIREVLKESADISRDIYDITQNLDQGVVSTVNEISAVPSALKNSKMLRFINVLAILGDNSLQLENLSIGDAKYQMDYTPGDEGKYRTYRNRDSTNKLRWRTSATKSLIKLNGGLRYLRKGVEVDSEVDYGKVSKKLTDKANRARSTAEASATARGASSGEAILAGIDASSSVLKSSITAAIESELDAEYMPFYFHDVRTGEIISFHAFLTDMSDSYTPAYDEVNAFGRVDPVYIYEKTKRDISVGFHIISTSESDMEEMWIKINKLVTLVYPQWSKGRQVNTEGVGNNILTEKSFIQPFSQVIAASPLIRLRLGDVFKSNYSKFHLARLFGAGSSDFNIARTDLSDPEITLVNRGYPEGLASEDKIAKVTLFPGEYFIAGSDNKRYSVTEEQVMYIKLDENEDYSGRREIYKDNINVVPGHVSDERKAAIRQYEEDKQSYEETSRQAILNRKLDAIDLFGGLTLAQSEAIEAAGVPFSEPKKPKGYFADKYRIRHKKDIITVVPVNVDGNLLLVPRENLGISSLSDIKTFGELKSAAALDSANEEAKFFNQENNAVVRSFESALGKGLAGVITSLKFDWYDDKITWDIEPGRKAPMWCKVSINFSPVHDIAPGIDHNGINRAPIYNVGSKMKAFNGEDD